MIDKPKNMAASVRQRLLNQARKEKQDHQRLLVRYAIERFLFRLSQSEFKNQFVLKGAMLFVLWSPQPFRSTGDLDLLGYGANDPESVRKIIAGICNQHVPDDGLRFDASSLTVEAAREDDEYQGARVRLDAHLGTAIITVQIDIGFGDVVNPAPSEIDYPVLIDELPAARIRAYPPETVIAEKFEAMVRFDDLTSRLKDHYDLWVLARTFSFRSETLETAISQTFERRGTPIPKTLPAPLTTEFALRRDKQEQWKAFLKRTTPTLEPPPFEFLVRDLRRFFKPIIAALNAAGGEQR
jgi:predicted nucleotidyltransferase component of viral defense system